MRPIEVLESDIIQAGNELLAAGRNITGFALRKVIGGGSAPRLRQVWDEHVRSRAMAKVEAVAELPEEVISQLRELSAALVQQLQKMAVEVNDKAVKAAERRTSDLVKSAGEQREQAERELVDASATVDELEVQLAVFEQDKKLLQVKLDGADAVIQKQAVQVAQLTERLAAAESATKAANEQRATDLAASQTAIQAHLAEIEKVREQAAAADAVSRQVAQQHVAALAEASGRTQDLAVELAQVKERLAAADAGVRAAGVKVESEAEKAVNAREEAARYAGQVDALERQVAELMAKVVVATPMLL